MWFLTVLSVMSAFALSHSYLSNDNGLEKRAFEMVEPYINAKVSDSPNYLEITEASYKYLVNKWLGDDFHYEFTTYMRETDCKKTVSDPSKCSYKDSGKRYRCTSQITRNSNKPWTIMATCENPVEEGTFTELINAPLSSIGKVIQYSHFWTDGTKKEMRELKKDVSAEIQNGPGLYRQVFLAEEVKKQIINEGKSVTYKLNINLWDTNCLKTEPYNGCNSRSDTQKVCDVVYRVPNGEVTKMFTIKCESSPLG